MNKDITFIYCPTLKRYFDISDTEATLLSYIMSYNLHGLECYCAITHLENVLCYTRPTITKAKKSLREKGLITCEKFKRNGQPRVMYSLTDKVIEVVNNLNYPNVNMVNDVNQGSKKALPEVVKDANQASKEGLPHYNKEIKDNDNDNNNLYSSNSNLELVCLINSMKERNQYS